MVAFPRFLKSNIFLLRRKIRWIAMTNPGGEEFTRRARLVAEEFGTGVTEKLAAEFHTESTPPRDLQSNFSGLGQWMTLRQFAIFEIFYYLGPATLPVLRRVAFGPYDWTQGNAIEILCRLAAKGIERTQIISELKQHLPEIREEAMLYAFGPLKDYAKKDPEIQKVLHEMLEVPELKEVYEEMIAGKT